LWIAFIFEYLWDMTQPQIVLKYRHNSCELLSFLSIFEIWHNFATVVLNFPVVVNCFHFWVSLRYDTTVAFIASIILQLWIAFIFEYLWDMTQLTYRRRLNRFSCELLSFLSIFEIWHNDSCKKPCNWKVVNCFHFWVSLRYDTTCFYNLVSTPKLWIAFIFEYLWDMTQRVVDLMFFKPGCELLSFLSIFEIWHNKLFFRELNLFVVNCFHFWVSLRYDTTCKAYWNSGVPLWIAFIFEYLWDMTQLNKLLIVCYFSCELLSFLSIFEIWHNPGTIKQITKIVVNCFHFWVSLRYDTTERYLMDMLCLLWIAFIFEYLWDMTQHLRMLCHPSWRCELLSFLSIFEIWHNTSRSTS